MALSVDVAICTWNRADLLEQTLHSLAGLVIPPGCRWRVIVVPNNCTDRTSEVLGRMAGLLPLEVCPESRQGHSFARNRAVHATTADLVIWTDDDVLVAPGWIEAYLAAADSCPDAAFFGGPIRIRFPDGKPDWVEENWQALRGCFAERDLGPEPVALAADRLPYGANFAVRGPVQRQMEFDTRLGRQGSLVVGDDELDLMRRILQAGQGGRWVPDAFVEHLIPAARATTGAVWDYFDGQGRLLAARNAGWSRSRSVLWWIETWHRMLYRWKRSRAPSPAWFAHLARSALAHGQRRELAARR